MESTRSFPWAPSARTRAAAVFGRGLIPRHIVVKTGVLASDDMPVWVGETFMLVVDHGTVASCASVAGARSGHMGAPPLDPATEFRAATGRPGLSRPVILAALRRPIAFKLLPGRLGVTKDELLPVLHDMKIWGIISCTKTKRGNLWHVSSRSLGLMTRRILRQHGLSPDLVPLVVDHARKVIKRKRG